MFLKRTRKNKNIDKKEQLIKLVASFIFLIGSFMYIGRIAYNYYVELRDYNKAQEFLNIGKEEVEEVKVDIDEEEIKEQPKQEEKKTFNYNYIGVLEIPKINIKRGFLNIKDKGNNVNKNLQVIKGSDMPNVKNGNLIIAAHSGNSYISYFKNLHKLSNDDVAYVYFNNIKYTYKVVGKYDAEKNGKVTIHRDNKKNTLTLITCSQTDKTKQIVYILELESEENYE
jgi:LPXTG-site transpeptidase (sortase) family protein